MTPTISILILYHSIPFYIQQPSQSTVSSILHFTNQHQHTHYSLHNTTFTFIITQFKQSYIHIQYTSHFSYHEPHSLHSPIQYLLPTIPYLLIHSYPSLNASYSLQPFSTIIRTTKPTPFQWIQNPSLYDTHRLFQPHSQLFNTLFLPLFNKQPILLFPFKTNQPLLIPLQLLLCSFLSSIHQPIYLFLLSPHLIANR